MSAPQFAASSFERIAHFAWRVCERLAQRGACASVRLAAVVLVDDAAHPRCAIDGQWS
jgi:hypothetical protein